MTTESRERVAELLIRAGRAAEVCVLTPSDRDDIASIVEENARLVRENDYITMESNRKSNMLNGAERIMRDVREGVWDIGSAPDMREVITELAIELDLDSPFTPDYSEAVTAGEYVCEDVRIIINELTEALTDFQQLLSLMEDGADVGDMKAAADSVDWNALDDGGISLDSFFRALEDIGVDV